MQKNLKDVEEHLTDLDKWILDETNILIIRAIEAFDRYDFHGPTVDIRHFIWEEFASHYLELVKNRAYNQNKEFTLEQQEAAIYTLNHVLEIILKLLAPVLPMITYKIYKELYGKDIHFEEFPKSGRIYKPNLTAQDVSELNSYIWKSKKDKGLSLKDQVKKLVIDEKFEGIQHDIISAHNILHLTFGERSIEL